MMADRAVLLIFASFDKIFPPPIIGPRLYIVDAKVSSEREFIAKSTFEHFVETLVLPPNAYLADTSPSAASAQTLG